MTVSEGTQNLHHRLTFGRLVFGARAVVAGEAGVEGAAEPLVVKHRERVEADAGLVVELAAVHDVAAAHLALRLLAGEAGVDSCGQADTVMSVRPPPVAPAASHQRTGSALLAEQLVFGLEGRAQAVEVEHAAALAFTWNQVLTCLLTHLQDGTRSQKCSEKGCAGCWTLHLLNRHEAVLLNSSGFWGSLNITSLKRPEVSECSIT